MKATLRNLIDISDEEGDTDDYHSVSDYSESEEFKVHEVQSVPPPYQADPNLPKMH